MAQATFLNAIELLGTESSPRSAKARTTMTATSSPSHITVFGASGKIGRHVVDQLLADGKHVTAYVRNPAKLTLTHPNLHRHRGWPRRPGPDRPRPSTAPTR